jgi:hypothetical protein
VIFSCIQHQVCEEYADSQRQNTSEYEIGNNASADHIQQIHLLAAIAILETRLKKANTVFIPKIVQPKCAWRRNKTIVLSDDG